MSDLEQAASDVELTKPAHSGRRKTMTAILIVLSIPLVVVIAGVLTTWWRPVTLVLICPVLKVMGYSKMAEPLAIRAVELYVHSDGLNSRQTMNALWNLAQVYVDNGKPAKAEPVYRTIAIYNAKHAGDGAVAPFQVLRAWSKTLRALGKESEANRIEAQVDRADPDGKRSPIKKQSADPVPLQRSKSMHKRTVPASTK
ncbi:MAG: tetratricopeptide repeat protein [Candidatus Melainabacteria bacterium]|nr:tetratricopeptide repeat protein [Candidatus Melainabacteria bacterium]